MLEANKCTLSILALALLALPPKLAIANDFSVADYSRFHELDVRMRPVADDLAAFMMRLPMTGSTTKAGVEAAVRTQDCMIRLAGDFDRVKANLDTVATLVALAAKMADQADEALVIRFLSLQAEGFLEVMKDYRTMLDATMSRCSQDGATIAKGKEISRIWSDAASLVQSVAQKIAPRPLK
jgi:hypothetical protein